MFIFIQIIGLIVNIGILTYIFLRLLNTKVGQAFYSVELAITVWILGELLMYGSSNPIIALEWTKFSNIGAAFLGPALIWFVLVSTNDEYKINKWKLIILLTSSLLFSIFSLKTNLIFSDILKTSWGYQTVNGILYYPFTIYVAGCSMAVIAFAIFSLTHLNKLYKKQMNLFILAFIIPIAGGIFSEIVAPIIGLNIPPLTSVLFSYTGIIIVYSVVKYQFLSITPALVLQNIFDTMKDFVIAVDVFGKIKIVNQSIKSTLGYEASELINQPISIIFGPNYPIETIKDILKKSPDGFTTTISHKTNGYKIPVIVNGNVIISSAGTEEGLVLITHDKSRTDELISNLKQKTIELDKSREKLEKNILENQKLNSYMVNREIKMAELKRQIKKLEKK